MTPATIPAVQPGMTYKIYAGANFFPLASADGYGRNGELDRQAGTTTDEYCCQIDVPNGAKITEIVFSAFMNDANGTSITLYSYGYSNDSYVPVAHLGIPTAAASIQTVFSSPNITVDTTTLTYWLVWYPGTAGTTQILKGVRVGYRLNPGFVTFASPQRVFDGFSTPVTSGTTYGPIDATQLAAGGSSGVPAGAKAIYAAVQILNNSAPGRATFFPDGTTDPNIANWTCEVGAAGVLPMLYMLVPLSSAGKFQLHSYITGNMFVDAWGYVV